MPIPPFANASGVSKSSLQATLRSQGWTVISGRSSRAGNQSIQLTAAPVHTSRLEIVSPWAYTQLRWAYNGWWNSNVISAGQLGENPLPTAVQWGASFGYQGATINEARTDIVEIATFKDGKRYAWCESGGLLLTDPLAVQANAGVRNFIKSSASLPLPAAPSAPTAASGSAGLLPANTYYVGVTIVYPDNVESLLSPVTSVVIGTNGSINVTAPTAVAGAIGYRVYLQTNVALTYGYDANCGVVPFTANAVANQYPSATLSLEAYKIAGQAGFITGGVVSLGNLGTGFGSANNGEGFSTIYDLTNFDTAVPAGAATTISPCAVFALCPNGVNPSVGIFGDSISAGFYDVAFVGAQTIGAGYIERALMNQTDATKCGYQASVAPSYGFINGGQSSETLAEEAGFTGIKRRNLLKNCTHIICEGGINDSGNSGIGVAKMIGFETTIAFDFLNAGCYYRRVTLCPRVTPTDSCSTVAGQTLSANATEADRRAFNNWVIDTNTNNAVTGDIPFRVATTPFNSTGTPYSGGDGTTQIFQPSYPILNGSEQVFVNGVQKTLTTDYIYLNGGVINGQTFESAIQFNSAPANGATITINYTKPPCPNALYAAYRNKYQQTVQLWSLSEVNGAGVPTYNGGFWHQTYTVLQSGLTVTAVTGSTATNTAWTWTNRQFQDAGAVLVVTADPTTPASVGSCIAIELNTATQIFGGAGWTGTTPSTNATFSVLQNSSPDGKHCTSYLYALLGGYLNTQLGTLTV